MLFNYDARIYQYQSSGMLWQAAYYGLPLVITSDNWLSREASRLGVVHSRVEPGDKIQLQIAIEKILQLRNQKPETRNQKPETRNQKPETRNQKPETRSYEL